jgi:uncharacterized protein YgiM (DUF1202 family)
MKRLRLFFIGALLAVCSSMVAAQEPIQTNKMTPLRAGPDDSATLVQTLAARTSVQVIVKRGAWNQVKVGTTTGWVRMMDLRGGATVEEAKAGSGSGFFSSFTRLLAGDSSGRGNQRAQSATVGIRGFSKEDVAKAEFNPAEFEKLKRFQVSSADAQQFANQGRLAFRSVAYLSQDAVEASGSKGAKK